MPNSRNDRRVAAKLQDVFAEELRNEDRKLLQEATDIALAMDGHSGMWVCRVLLIVGKMPEGMCLAGQALLIIPGDVPSSRLRGWAGGVAGWQ